MSNLSHGQVLAVIWIGGFFLLGGIAILRALLAIARGHASRCWPRTTGTIIESRVAEHVNADGQFVFFPQVRYQYVVGEQRYESVNIRFPTKSCTSRRRAEILVAKYPATTSTMVSFHSAKPAVSVLEPGLTGTAFLDAALGVGFLLSSALGCYYFFGQHPY
jgi:hypothetical protein